jgi:transketolase
MRPVCLDAIYQLAKRDKRIVFIGSDIGYNLIDDYRRELPGQFYLEGISEQNLVSVAAGMAHEGKIVYLASIACFFSRAYEQIKLDVALHNLPVRLVGFGGGVMYSHEGPTHVATDDIALMRAAGVTVIAPADKVEMAALMPQTVDYPGPLYIRLGWGEPVVTDGITTIGIIRYFGEYIFDKGVHIITTGNMLAVCLEVQKEINKSGILSTVHHMSTILDFHSWGQLRSGIIVTVEEGIVNGGLGDLIAQHYPVARRFGLPLFPTGYGTRLDMLARYGLTAENIAQTIKTLRS